MSLLVCVEDTATVLVETEVVELELLVCTDEDKTTLEVLAAVG